jgi:hypothetical protein
METKIGDKKRCQRKKIQISAKNHGDLKPYQRQYLSLIRDIGDNNWRQKPYQRHLSETKTVFGDNFQIITPNVSMTDEE